MRWNVCKKQHWSKGRSEKYFITVRGWELCGEDAAFDNDTSGEWSVWKRWCNSNGAITEGRLQGIILLMERNICYNYDWKRGEQMKCEKTLLSFEEFCNYVGIGKTKARELISNPCCKYVVRIGRRVFIHKELFDEELKKNAKYGLTM